MTSSHESRSRAAKNCPRCDKPFTKEERKFPNRDRGDGALCDSCCDELYMDTCPLCMESVEKDDLDTKPGALIAIWRDAPACGQDDLKPGYYRVLSWPIYADGMVEGYFFGRALQRMGDLDDRGKRAADESHACAGPMCSSCRGKAALHVIASLQSEKPSLLGNPEAHEQATAMMRSAERDSHTQQDYSAATRYASRLMGHVRWLEETYPDAKVMLSDLREAITALHALAKSATASTWEAKYRWLLHNGGLLNEWARDWNGPESGPLIPYLEARIEAEMRRTESRVHGGNGA